MLTQSLLALVHHTQNEKWYPLVVPRTYVLLHSLMRTNHRINKSPNSRFLSYSSGLSACSYCAISHEDAWIVTEFVIAVLHPEPLAPCHAVIAPRRHVAAFYDLDVEEQRMIWESIGEIRQR